MFMYNYYVYVLVYNIVNQLHSNKIFFKSLGLHNGEAQRTKADRGNSRPQFPNYTWGSIHEIHGRKEPPTMFKWLFLSFSLSPTIFLVGITKFL